MSRPVLSIGTGLVFAISSIAVAVPVSALAQSDAGEQASGGVAGGNTGGTGSTGKAPSATGETASSGVAGGDSAGSEGSAAGGDGPSDTGAQASGGVAGGINADADAPGVSEALGRFAGANVADVRAELDAMDDVEIAALEEECALVTASAGEYSAATVSACEVVSQELASR